MLISRRNDATSGICFAWLPKWTPDGKVWLEWVHYEHIPSWGWGSGDTYHYARWVPEKRYEQGERRDFCQCRYEACVYPRCTCMNIGGSKCRG